MNLTIKTINDKKKWEKFILNQPEANFLQSYAWGEFQKSLNKKIFRFGLFLEDKQIGACEAIKEEAKRGDYLTVAGGPLVNWKHQNSLQYLKKIFDHLSQIAQTENCLFIRFRPQEKNTNEIKKLVHKIGCKKAPMHLTADLTLQLDLNKSEDELLADMRKNTRYEIRKSMKKNIKVEISTDPQDIKEFHEHQLYLANKHNFVPFSYEFFYKQFKEFRKNDNVLLFHSYHEGKLLASAFIIFYNKEAVYHYGISTPDNQKLPGSYACQWAAIKEAKKRGCLRYNFWGVAPKENKEHRFAGVSIFKRGFGGFEYEYLPAHDLAVSPLYIATKTFELVRKKVRKL